MRTIILLTIIALCYVNCQSPPIITSYTIEYSKKESGFSTTGKEYYSYSTDQFYVEDSGQGSLVNVISNGETYVGFNPSTGYCETYCAYYNVCPPNPNIHCSAGHRSYFEELVNATQSGSCKDGSVKWVALSDQGTINEYSSGYYTYCISSNGTPHSLTQKFVSETTDFFDLNISSYVAVIPKTCACVYNTTSIMKND